MNKLLISISSKNPTNLLIQNITNLNNFFNDYEKKLLLLIAIVPILLSMMK